MTNPSTTSIHSWIAGLPAAAEVAGDLVGRGFGVLPPTLPPEELEIVRRAYHAAIVAAAPDDVAISESLRVHDLVNADSSFDRFFLAPTVLALVNRVLNAPFKLSSLLARTVPPGARSQELHIDCSPDDLAEPELVGLIVPVDDFTATNGATRFVPGSHGFGRPPQGTVPDLRAAYPGQAIAAAPAGSCILYDARVWHGYTANGSAHPRASIQGAFVRRDRQAARDWATRLLPATRARLSALGRYLLSVD